MRTSTTILSVLLFAMTLVGQSRHVVQGGGAALQQAIAAGSPGDEYDVLPGIYLPVQVSRGLRLELRSGAVIAPSAFPFATPGVTITGLPAGEFVVLAGGTVHGIVASNCQGDLVVDGVTTTYQASWPASLQLTGCTGTVAWQGVSHGPVPTFGSFDIANCAHVSLHRCRLPRTTIAGAAVAMSGTDILPFGGGPAPGTRPTLRLGPGTLAITGGRIWGGVAASLPYHESAVHVDAGHLVVTGGADLRESQDFVPVGTVPAVVVAGGGSAHFDPGVTLIGTPPVAGAGTWSFATVPALAVAHGAGSSSLQVSLQAEPLALAFVLIALAQPVQQSPFGPLWLAPDSPILGVTTLPGTGTAQFPSTWNGVPPWLPLVLQAATLAPSGTIAVSTPVRFVWN